ncbi:tape measure protein [Microbacterium sp. Re1]|uniref:Tape measure protein n=1 Tax=Microbacterium commune TaxID=2762219 RepID=A0ABR8W6K5_9MICO|nr:tape measure protein [Microbacterium commune]MBD8012657.1 tape measure protein [Microbacterium commune]
MSERVVRIRLSADIADYKRAFLEASEAAKRAADEGTKASKQESEAARKAAEAAKQKLDAWKSLGTGLLAVGGTMTALTLAVAKTGVEYNTLQQTSRAALSTLLGGAEAANAQMDKLDAFARTSPFSKQTFITAQQQMLAFGIESKKVIPYLDAIGEAVAAAGGSNQELGEIAFVMAQISSAGKITAQDLMQFGQRGVNAAELIGSQMGKTGAEIRAQITAGTLGADQALDALASGMKEKFDGASANVKMTFAGAMDRVKAAWRDLSADLTKPLVDPSGGGLFVDLLNRLADVLRMFQSLPEPVKLAGGALFALVGITATVTGAAILAKIKWMEFSATLDTLGPMGARVKGILGGIGNFLTGPWGVALLGATVALGVFMQKQAEAKARAEAYAAAIDTATGALSAHGDELIMNDLTNRSSVMWWQDTSIADAAENLGISLNVVFDAVKNGGDAMTELERQLDAKQAAFKGTADEAEQFALKVDKVRGGVQRMSGELGDATEMARQQAEMSGEQTDASGQVSEAFAEQEQASKELQDALQGVVTAYEEMAHGQMDVAKSHDSALSAINSLTEATKNEEAAIDGTNDASIKLRDSLRDVEQKSYDSATAIVQNTGDMAAARAEWDAGREAVIAQLKAKGMDEAAARAWADKNLGSAKDVELALAAVKDQANALPNKKEIAISESGSEALAVRLANLRDLMSSIPNVKKVTLESYVVGNRTVGIPGQATGGPVFGPGPKGKDSELRMLAPGEHVVTAAEVDAAGGHAAIMRWRQSILNGSIPGLAAGGPVRPESVPVSARVVTGAPVVNVAAPSMPSEFVLKDMDGALIGRMQVEAAGVVAGNSARVASGIRSRRRSDA